MAKQKYIKIIKCKFYEYYKGIKTPSITIRGQWMKEFFNNEDNIKVEVYDDGKIVLTKRKE